MPFANSIVGGVTLVRPAIRSPDYVPGVSGWAINRDGTVEFNNGDFRGTITAATIIGSVFGTSTTDPSLWLNEDNANSLRIYDENSDLVVEIGADVQTDASAVFYDIANATAISIGQQIQWLSGSPILTQFGALYQTANGIIFNTILTGGLGWDVAHAAWVKVVPGSDNFAKWHEVGATGNAAYNTGWSGATMFNGSGNGPFNKLRYRQDTEDNAVLEGLAVTSTGASATLLTLPSGYFNPNARALLEANFVVGGVVSSGFVQVTETGIVNATSSISGHTVGANTQIYIKGKIPLGNVA